ncbi:MAG: hypothetical protein LUG95_08290 [Clostridiales bacterium]|nr:hypothetical protein [Clostridiales bacterium]
MAMVLSMIMFIVSSSVCMIPAYAASVKNLVTISSVKQNSYNNIKVKVKSTANSYKDTASAILYGYEFQYSTNKDFKKGVNSKLVTNVFYKILTVSLGNIAQSDDYATLVSNVSSKYYIIVRTVYINSKNNYNYKYSSWSAIKSIKISYEGIDDGAYSAALQAKTIIATLNITDNMTDLEKITRVQNWINHNWYYYKESATYTAHGWNAVKIDGYWYQYDSIAYKGYDYNSTNKDDLDYKGFITVDKSANMVSSSLKVWKACYPKADSTVKVETREKMGDYIIQLLKGEI